MTDNTNNITSAPLKKEEIDEAILAANEVKLIGPLMIDADLAPVNREEVDAAIAAILGPERAKDETYSMIVDRTITKIVEELELLVRVSNPSSKFSPLWIEQSVLDGDVSLAEIQIARDDFQGYSDTFIALDDLTEKQADDVMEFIASYVKKIGPAIEYYYLPSEDEDASPHAANAGSDDDEE